MGGWVAGWVGGWVAGWLAGWVAGWVGGWVGGWLAGWLAGCWGMLCCGSQGFARHVPMRHLHSTCKHLQAPALRALRLEHAPDVCVCAGRAGRRGYDTVGNCVILQSKWEDPSFAWDIIRKGPEPLRSQFSTGYGMVLNLLYTRSLEEARAFLDRSFSRFLGGIGTQVGGCC